MLPYDYYRMSSNDFNLLCDGFKRRTEANDKKQVVLIRQICWTVLQGYVDPKKAPKTIEDYWPINGKQQLRKRTKKQNEDLKKTIAHLKTLHNG